MRRPVSPAALIMRNFSVGDAGEVPRTAYRPSDTPPFPLGRGIYVTLTLQQRFLGRRRCLKTFSITQGSILSQSS